MEERMSKTTPAPDTRVKELSLIDGYLHIDLFDGLRLSGPIKRAQEAVSRLSEDPPSFDWDDDALPSPA
jgi:hypothetical protein